MKKFLSLLLVLLLTFVFVGCSGKTNEVNQMNSNANNAGQYGGGQYNQDNVQNTHVHSYSGATCTSPAKCSCGATYGSSLGHAYSGKNCTRCGVKNPNYTEPSQSNHTHYYSSRVTKEATCAKEGVRTYTCSCGSSYTEKISKSTYHDWENATCTSPKKCNDCGKTEGTAEDHDYKRYDGYKCSMCGKIDPTVKDTLAKCSLQLPTLPKTVTYYGYSGKIQSKVSVTNITYEFEYYDDGNVILTAKFSGKKTYDNNGSGQSAACRIGWKLYDPSGNVFRTGTFSSPSVAMGESFANQEEDLIYNFEAAKPGQYRLEILDVN